MNLIVCDKRCIHQQEGYCKLDSPTGVIVGADISCAYFSKSSTPSTHGVLAQQVPEKDF